MDINKLRKSLRKAIISETNRPRSRRIARLWSVKESIEGCLSDPTVQEFIRDRCTRPNGKIRWMDSRTEELEEIVAQWVSETGVRMASNVLTQHIIDRIDDMR